MTVKTFLPYPINTLDRSQYTVINLKDKLTRYAYLIINNTMGDYLVTQSLGGINVKLTSMFGHDIEFNESGKLYCIPFSKTETLIPSKIEFNADGELIEVILVKNLLQSGLKRELEKRGIAS